MQTFLETITEASFYALSDQGDSGAMLISSSKAKEMNDRNYGIFWTLNEFKHGIRRKENLIKINCWAIDIDEETKAQQMKKIKKSPLAPSMIVETKRGYQCYWFAKDASIENYSAIVEHRLIPFFNADTRAKDVCRILRVPEFYHCKDLNDKFLVKLVKLENIVYCENEMMVFFKAETKALKKPTQEMKLASPNGFWEAVSNIPIDQALCNLSGLKELNYENFRLVENTNGTYQITVNGKKTSSWVDHDGMIGSYDNGGPTVCQWVNWYTKDYKKTYKILKKVFERAINAQKGGV